MEFYPRSVTDRFWAKVDRSGGPDACWPWTGSKTGTRPYGEFWVAKRERRRATQVAWEIKHKRSFPRDKRCCHSCDNPSCVNWRHLFVGSQSENLMDASRKGRIGKGETHYTRQDPAKMAQWLAIKRLKGEQSSRAKLTEAQVMEIIRAVDGGTPGVELARRFGVLPTCICNIVKGRTWRHLDRVTILQGSRQ